MQVKDTVDRATVKRVERGWILYKLGHVERHGDVYTVRAQDSKRYYTVALEHSTQGETCSCPDHRERGNTCKHIYSATIADSKQQQQQQGLGVYPLALLFCLFTVGCVVRVGYDRYMGKILIGLIVIVVLVAVVYWFISRRRT